MEQKNKIHLSGYFDLNFGDDMMMKLVVRNLPEVTFVIEKNLATPIINEPNVIVREREYCKTLPGLVVIGSGFMINNKDALKSELFSFLKGRTPGDYCLGCNIEPLDTPIKRFLISSKIKKFKLITCRDNESYNWIKKHTRHSEVHFLPDILFSFPDEWIPESNEKNKLGISLMHRVGDKEDCTYYREMAEIADEWVQKTGKDVILMAFDTGAENDLFACNSVKALMKFSEHVEIVAHKDGTEIPAAFAQCEKIIAARFHASVLALRMGIPLYPLIFREKVRNLLKDLEYPHPICNIDDINKASMYAFLEEEQIPYQLEKHICSRANEHALLLKKHLRF